MNCITTSTKWFIFQKKWLVLVAGAVRNRTYRRGRTVSCASLVGIKFLARRSLNSYPIYLLFK